MLMAEATPIRRARQAAAETGYDVIMASYGFDSRKRMRVSACD